MKAFESMAAAERFAIPQSRQNASFTALRSTLGFEFIEMTLAGQEMTKGFTTPPSPVMLTPENVGKIFANTGDDWKGKWLRFLFLTYFYEGQIFFRKLDDKTFEVEVKF